MYKRRIWIFLGIVVFGMCVLIGKLAHLQLVNAQKYLQSAEEYLRQTELLPAMRGRILDRKGRILAIDEPCYDLCVDYRFLTADARFLSESERASVPYSERTDAMRWIARKQQDIARENQVSEEQAEQILRRRWENTLALCEGILREKGSDYGEARDKIIAGVERLVLVIKGKPRELFQAHPIFEGLNEEEAVAIRLQMSETVGLEVRPSHKRVYPFREIACHIIGVTGEVSREEMDRYNAPRNSPDWLTWRLNSYLPGDRMGKTGIEKMSEPILKGQRGYRVHRAREVIPGEPAHAGGDVHLTLDIELQRRLTEAFYRIRAEEHGSQDDTGSIVVLDITTGNVLAMTSFPQYDLNLYRKDFSRLISDEIGLPLRSRSVTQIYAPGSTVKPVAAMCALGANKIGLETSFTCHSGGYLFPDIHNAWRCWSRTGHGPLNVVEGLRYSCNPFFYHVGQALGPKLLCDWYRLFGFGEKPGTGLPEERSGIVPTDSWMQRRYKRGMTVGDARMMAIGQGTLAVSPLHVANAMATLARGGRYISPQIALEGGPPRVRRDLPMADYLVKAIHQGMRDVVHHERGTAHTYLKEELPLLDFEFCGKTGTADIPPQRIDADGDGRITRKDPIVRQGNAAWFSGFAPYGNPQIAFVVMVEYAEGGGGKNTARIGLEVLRICEEMGYLSPGGMP